MRSSMMKRKKRKKKSSVRVKTMYSNVLIFWDIIYCIRLYAFPTLGQYPL